MHHSSDRNFSLHHLGAFQTVLESGRLSAAGERLRRSASAISRSIAILEERFDRQLVLRAASGITPTPEGELVAARCAIIQTELNDLRDKLVQSHGGDVRTNASTFQMHIDVSRLRALIAVHDLGSVQRACQMLAVSQPAVSASLRHLEEDLGIELFSRTPAGMVPTSAGVVGAVTCRRILSELRKMQDDVDSFDSAPSGLVCVGGLAYSRTALLPEAIKRTLSTRPKIKVRTVEGPIHSLLTALHAGDIDILISTLPMPALLEGVSVEPMVKDQTKLFASSKHPLARRKGITARELLDHPFILPPLGTATRDMLDDTFRRETGRTPNGSIETSSYSIIRYLLLNSDLISFRSVMEFQADLPSGNIVELDLAFPLPNRSICVLQRCGVKRTAAVTEFLDIVRLVPGRDLPS